MKQILCVIDFSESAGRVWEVAAGIACACGAHLTVLFPYRLIDYNYHGDVPSLKKKLETEAKAKFISLKKSDPFTENIPCEFHAEIGFLADRVSAYVKKNNIDMVVIGQEHTSTGVDLKTFNLQDLIAASRLPFVIVPSKVSMEATV
jgi:nucleotide-binding universal stress UspA family protein